MGVLGRSVRRARVRQGVSREDLAAAVGRSLSWLNQVETGHLRLDSWHLINVIADALGVDVTEITGDTHTRHGVRADRAHAVLPGLRRALLLGPGLVDGLAPRSVDELRGQADRVRVLHHRGRHADLAAALPDLLADAHRLAATDGGAAAYDLLGQSYAVASMTCYRLGYTELAALAAERTVSYAQWGGDHLLAFVGAWRQVCVLRRLGGLEASLRRATMALDGLDGLLGTDQGPAWSLAGMIHLEAAIATARRQDRSGAADHLRHAERAAGRAGERNDYLTAFGPSNVAMHRLVVAVELGEGAGAIERARRMHPRTLPNTERRAHFLIDLARAHGQARRDDEALRVLLAADRLAPAQVRNYPLAAEMVSDMLDRRRTYNSDLRAMARRLGLFPTG